MFQVASLIEQSIFIVGLVVNWWNLVPAQLLSVPGIDRYTRCNLRADASGNQFGEATPSKESGDYPTRRVPPPT